MATVGVISRCSSTRALVERSLCLKWLTIFFPKSNILRMTHCRWPFSKHILLGDQNFSRRLRVCSLVVNATLTTFIRGVAIGGSWGSDEPPPPMGRKRSAKIGFFFVFLSGIAQESVFVEKDERTSPIENKSCKTRHGQAQLAFEWHFAQTPSLPKKTSRRPTCKTRRGQVRMPNASIGRYTVELSDQRRASSSTDW